MPFPLIPAIFGALTGAYLFFGYGDDDEASNGEFVGPIPPIPGEGSLIDIDTPIGDINLDNKLLILPVLWILFKYKPWK